MNTIVPVEVAQVGCAVTLAAGVVGAPGAAFTVTAVPVAVQELLAVVRTTGVYEPGATPVNILLAWKLVPLIEYSTPACEVKVMVPV